VGRFQRQEVFGKEACRERAVFPAEGGFENKSGKSGASESSSLESARGLALRQNRNTLDSSAVAVSTTDGGFCEAHKRETDTDISVPAGGKMFP